MKKFAAIVLSVLLLGNAPLLSQESEAQKVHSLVKVYKEHDWYVNQYQLWKEAITNRQKEPEAWLNYYTAARMSRLTAKENEKRQEWQKKMDAVIEAMKKAVPDTYVYYRLMAWHHPIFKAKDEEEKEKFISYSEKAYEIDPDRPSVYPTLMNIYKIEKDAEKVKEIARKWRNSDDIPPSMYAMNYNALQSVEQNGVLITGGDNDTYPAWLLQSADGIRTDVTVMNLSLLYYPPYRKMMFSSLGLPELEKEYPRQMDLVNHVIEHLEQPLYFSVRGRITSEESLKDKLYNVGMAMKYCEDDFNNISVLVRNFEEKYLTDHLELPLYREPFPQMTKVVNQTYIPGLAVLYNHYLLIEEDDRAEETKALILSLAKDSPYEDKILETFEKSK